MSVERSGEVVVPAERLLAIVREMGDVEISLEADERYCTICGEGSEFRIFVMDVVDFPPVADFEDQADLVIEGRDLRRMIALTLYAAARETSRYAINGVLWEKIICVDYKIIYYQRLIPVTAIIQRIIFIIFKL